MKYIQYLISVSVIACLTIQSDACYIAEVVELPALGVFESDTLVIKKVKIIGFKKVLDQTSKYFKKYGKGCGQWELSKDQLEWIMLHSRAIDGQTFSYDFSVLPCYYEGEVIVNDTIRLKFEVNAGSYTALHKPKLTMWLGYYGKQKLFLQTPGIE